MKHIKILGLLAMAALVVAGLLGATSASAAKFTASAGAGVNLNVTTIGKHVLTITGNKVECNKITFTGTTAGAESETQTVQPKYEECTLFGFANATINTSGCSYTLHSGVFNAAATDHTTVSPTGHATVDLTGCTSHNGGMTFTVNVPFIAKCNVFIYNQTGINGVHYTSNGAGGDIVVEFTTTNTKAKVTESTGACPFTAGQTHENVSYTGSSTYKAASGTLSYDPS